MGLIIGSVSLTYPFGRDQGIYAYAGKMLLEGKMNYRYVFDLKPPGIHFLFAFAQFITGESMLNMRLFDIVWQSVTGYLLFIISYRLTDRKILSLIASFLYIFLYYRQDYWHTLQADGMLNLPIAASVLLLILSFERHSFAKIFLSGVLFGITLLFKYTIISFLPLMAVCLLVISKELKSIKIKNLISYFTGMIFVALVIVLLYYFTDSLNELINAQFVQTPLYTKIAYETENKDFIISHIFRLFTFSVYAPLIFFSFISLVLLIIKKKLSFATALWFCWVISALFSLIVQWKFYNYHFLVIIPPLSIGAVLVISVFLDAAGEKRRKFVLMASCIVFLGLIILGSKPYSVNYQILYKLFSGKETLKEAYIQNGTTTDSVFMISKTLNAIDYVNQHSNYDDYVYVWGFDPLVYYLSGRKCVSRFIYSFPLFWKVENKGFRTEFMNEVIKNNPKLILIASNDPLYFISGYNEDSKQLLERFPEFKEFISGKYVFKKKIDDYDFYELKSW